MNAETEKRLLQMAVGLSCLVPLGAGLTGGIDGASMLSHPTGTALDSHYRYLSGLLLGIGLSFLFTIPDLHKQGERFAISWIVIIGGVARFYGLLHLEQRT